MGRAVSPRGRSRRHGKLVASQRPLQRVGQAACMPQPPWQLRPDLAPRRLRVRERLGTQGPLPPARGRGRDGLSEHACPLHIRSVAAGGTRMAPLGYHPARWPRAAAPTASIVEARLARLGPRAECQGASESYLQARSTMRASVRHVRSARSTSTIPSLIQPALVPPVSAGRTRRPPPRCIRAHGWPSCRRREGRGTLPTGLDDPELAQQLDQPGGLLGGEDAIGREMLGQRQRVDLHGWGGPLLPRPQVSSSGA